ncbi:MAG: hypothetical protein P4N60_06975 [Verrucomicrobiae bacterium]|nr:hypothetical protein [Verrucomicrobiae bacterium]
MTSILQRKSIFLATVLVASLWLLWLFDDGLGMGWPSDTLRNWQQCGVTTLHGALVFNPGGFEAVTAPQIYHGMSPFCLYTVLICTKLLGWTGLGTFSFFLVLGVLVLWGTWSLLGRGNFAQLAAVAVILSPGYGRWLVGIDPNAISVLLGIPYAAAVTELLKKPRLRAADSLLIFLLTGAFVILNWTTAWVLTPFGIFLLATSQVRRARAVKFLTVAAAGSILFVFSSMLAKSGGAAVGGGGAGQHFLGGYTWGNYGYGEGLTTSRAFIRIFFITTIGLLPVLLLWAMTAFHKFRVAPANGFIALLPLGVALLEIAAMRNYFGHHPWMAPPVVIVGLIFSINLLSATATESRPATGGGLKRLVFIAAVCLVYGLAVVSFYRANGSEGRSLTRMVRHETARTDWIVLVKNVDPVTAQQSDRLDGTLDRHVVVVDDLKDLPAGQSLAILTAVPMNGGQLIAQERVGSGSGLDAVLPKAADWFNRTISRRKPGDRPEFASQYYLYRPAP